MKKRTFAAILAGLLVCGTMLTSCSDHIKDTNGEDNYDVVELTADDLIANGATIVPSDTKKVEEKDGMTTYSDENTSGVATVATFKASEELEAGTKGDLHVIVNNKAESGNLKVVLIQKKGTERTIIHTFTVNDSENFIVEDIGTYYDYEVRFAAESANIHIEVTFEFEADEA